MTIPDIKLSIIIPTSNSGATLKETLDSIICQTFTNYEVLLLDNLSQDDTIDIINFYQLFHDNIRLVSGRDKGIYDAMNKGIKLAKGEWIYFLGSDDLLYNSDILGHIFSSAVNSFDVIYGDVNSTRFSGRYDGEFNNIKILSQNICHQAIFFKKAVFEKTGLFNLRYKSHADWDNNMHWFLSTVISKVYINFIVAEYADGGRSSLLGDPKFEKEKILKYLIYGKNQFTTNFKIRLLLKELKRTIIKHNFDIFAKLILNIPMIMRKS